MSWKISRVFNNLNYKINKVVFMQVNDVTYDYDDTIEIIFNKYSQTGNIDVINGVLYPGDNSKLLLEINLFYKYVDADFAPRYVLNLYKNDILLNKHYCGMNDNTENVNNIYLVDVLDVVIGDKIKVLMIKDSSENSTSKINILKNSFLNYKTF